MRPVLTVIALVAALCAAPVDARPPSAEIVLERLATWHRALPRAQVEYALRIIERGKTRETQATLTDARAFASPESSFADSRAVSLYTALLRGEGKDAMTSRGIDVAITAFYHLDRRVVVILGAAPMQTGRSQVWFDRDTGAPVRILLAPSAGATQDDSTDLSVGAHDHPGTEGRFPGTLRLHLGEVAIHADFRRLVPVR